MASTRLPNLNRVMIVGNLTRDPDLRATTAGVPVINFRIASNRRFKDNSGEWREDVCYVGVVAWQKLAESCAARLSRGSAVYVEGELRSRTFDNGDGTKRNLLEIRAYHIQFLDKDEKPDDDSKDLDSFEPDGNSST
jgi:single-strand DNA-binding protein